VLPPPQPTTVKIPPNIARKIVAANAPEKVKRRVGAFKWRFTPSATKKSRMTATIRAGTARRAENGVEGGILENGTIALVPLLVATNTVKSAGFPFETCSVAGPWMVAAAGAPLYARETVPV
jgi:hypothetical protein